MLIKGHDERNIHFFVQFRVENTHRNILLRPESFTEPIVKWLS